MKTLLIINPHSHSGKSAADAVKCMRYLDNMNYPFEYINIREFGDAYNLSVEANKNGIDNIVAIGGDGTINKVISGFYDKNGKRVSKSRFGVIYTGTSPDFCKSYNIPTDIYKACDILINQKTREIPVGLIRFSKLINSGESIDAIPKENQETRVFACCANIGLGAELARKANSGARKYLGDFLGTLFILIGILIRYKGTTYNILRDAVIEECKNAINLSVGITNFIASGIKVKQNEELQGKLFYLLKTSNIKLSNIFKLLKIIYSGKEFTNTDFISLEYINSIDILNNKVHPEIEFDGDPAGFLPCSIQMSSDLLEILC